MMSVAFPFLFPHTQAFIIITNPGPRSTTNHWPLRKALHGHSPFLYAESSSTSSVVHSTEERHHHQSSASELHHDDVAVVDEVSSQDKYLMGLALDQARLAFDASEIPVGAILVLNDGQILASARNRVEEKRDASAHAELECLRQAAALHRDSSWRMSDCTLYVTLEPCLMCLGSIQSFRVKRLVYGARNHLLGAIESYIKVLDHRHPFHELDVLGGVEAEECGSLMKDFFAQRRLQSRKGEHDGEGHTSASRRIHLPPMQQ